MKRIFQQFLVRINDFFGELNPKSIFPDKTLENYYLKKIIFRLKCFLLLMKTIDK